LKLSVSGNATLYRRAERAVVSIKVHSEGPSQEAVSKEVTARSNELRTTLKTMALKDPSGDAAADASISHWSMKTLSTGSHLPQDRDGKKLPREYTASTTFSVRFKDFAELGSFASMISRMENVSVQQVSWELTDATKASLGSKSRIEAIKNAMQQANDYSQALGRGEVIATEVIGGHGGVNYGQNYASHGHGGYYGGGSGAAGAEELNFEPENVSYVCNVTVKYKTA